MLEKIRTDRKNAMIEKNKVKRTILTTLLGELDLMAKKPEMIGKELTEGDVIKKVKSLIQSNIECNTYVFRMLSS